MNKLPGATGRTYVGDINMHLQQKTLRNVREIKLLCKNLLCTCCILVIKILEKDLSRASTLLDLQGSNLQLYKIRSYKIRGVSRTPRTSKGASTKMFRRA